MNATRTGPEAFKLEFETEEELREEHRTNLSQGGLRIPTTDDVPLHTTLTVALHGPWGGEALVQGAVVASLPNGLALFIEADADELLASLLAGQVEETEESNIEVGSEDADDEEETGEDRQTAWDRIRGLPQVEKIILASKAGKIDRGLLLQENDPRVLLALLRNPRITAEEVARLSRSAFLNYQIADVLLKSPKWSGNMEIKLGLVRNPKTPQAFALRILPTLPDSELRSIARAGASMALKQAALRKLQGIR